MRREDWETQEQRRNIGHLHNDAGFSLVETILVLVFAAVIFAPLYTIIVNMTQQSVSENRMDIIRVGLAEHLRVFGYLPCPARLDARPGEDDYYVNNRASEQDDCVGTITVTGVNGGDVYIGALPIDQLSLAMDCDEAEGILPDNIQDVFQRKLHDVKEIIRNQANPEDNYSAAKTCIPRHFSLDEHGNKFVYAVTANATKIETFDPHGIGEIMIVDAENHPLVESAVFHVFVSLGENRKGAYNNLGEPILPVCGVGNVGIENQNCNFFDDAIFRDHLLSRSADENDHFDDEIDYSLAGAMLEENLWYWGAGDNANTRNIFFNPESKMILDTLPSTGIIEDTDQLVVNRGDIKIQSDGAAGGSLFLQSDGITGAVALLSAGNRVRAGREIRAPAVKAKNRGGVQAKFCYDPPLTPDCGAAP